MKYRLCTINKDVKNLFAVAGFSELKKKEGKSFCLVGEDGGIFAVSGQIPIYHINEDISKDLMKMEASAYFTGVCNRADEHSIYNTLELDTKKTGEIKSGMITSIPSSCTNLGISELFIDTSDTSPYLPYLKNAEKNIEKALKKDKKKDCRKEMEKLGPILSNPRYTTFRMVEKQKTLYSDYDIVLVPAGEEKEGEKERVYLPPKQTEELENNPCSDEEFLETIRKRISNHELDDEEMEM